MLPRLKSPIALAAIIHLISACGPDNQSAPMGHFENFSFEELEAFRGKQIVPPEYAPSQAAIISSSLLTTYGREDLVRALVDAGADQIWLAMPAGAELEDEEFQALSQTMGSDMDKIQVFEQGRARNESDEGWTPWVRDWAPLLAKDSEDQLVLLDFNYHEDRRLDDMAPQILAEVHQLQRVSIPVYNEGGNFMTNGKGHCMMTERVTQANSMEHAGTALDEEIYDADEIAVFYQDYVGCGKVTIFPMMPGEQTGHIDSWAKFIDDETIILNELSMQTINQAATAAERDLALKVRSFLEDRAADLKAMGYQLRRIPMPLPRQRIFRTYANSILFNDTAIIPRYTDTGFADSSLLEGYESLVSEAYAASGYQVVFIESDRLIRSNGALHCVTMQVPR